jgi:hypothetical protein
MDTEQALLLAGRQRTQARVYTRRGDLDRAADGLEKAVRSLLPSLAATEGDSGPVTSRVEVAGALADTYGMLGGVEWRRGNLSAALRAYERGREIEQNEAYNLSDSYNLVNAIVLTILLEPMKLADTEPELNSAIRTVRRQVEGERRDQWWAWADFSLLNVLAGHVDDALDGYNRFFSCGPTSSDYGSVRRVLVQLLDKLRTGNPRIANAIVVALGHLETFPYPA